MKALLVVEQNLLDCSDSLWSCLVFENWLVVVFVLVLVVANILFLIEVTGLQFDFSSLSYFLSRCGISWMNCERNSGWVD